MTAQTIQGYVSFCKDMCVSGYLPSNASVFAVDPLTRVLDHLHCTVIPQLDHATVFAAGDRDLGHLGVEVHPQPTADVCLLSISYSKRLSFDE